MDYWIQLFNQGSGEAEADGMNYPPVADAGGRVLLCLAGVELAPPVCSSVFNFSRLPNAV